MKRKTLILLAVVLFLLPVVGRLGWFYRGWYRPANLPQIEAISVMLTTPEHRVVEAPSPITEGQVVIDLAHGNNLEVDDLTPLQNRLAARGLLAVNYDGAGDLAEVLRGALAYVVLAPTQVFTIDDVQAIRDFVSDGGRLLIAADPTRPVPPEEEDDFLDLSSIFFPTSAVPAANSLASEFGITFYDDYVYNLKQNEGNYRNIRLAVSASEQPLMQGLKEVVFFAAHSLRSPGIVLFQGDENTLSPLRTGEVNLTVGTLAEEGNVLALGDLTFMTPGYHTIADNDRLLSNIADWLGSAARDWDLQEFPYIYSGTVQLVNLMSDKLDPRLVVQFGELRDVLIQAGLDLKLQTAAGGEQDVLYLATFDVAESIHEYLTAAGITLSLSDSASEEGTEEALEGEAGEGSVGEDEPTDQAGTTGTITFEDLGTMEISGTTVYLMSQGEDRMVVIVLAEDEERVLEGLGRLVQLDYSGCVPHRNMIICSTGETLAKSEEEPTQEPGGTAAPSVLIIADDDGPEGFRTSVTELLAILGERYQVSVWSTAHDGIPTEGDIHGFDGYVIDTGDYAFDVEDADTFRILSSFENAVFYIGAQSYPVFSTAPDPVDDLEVAKVDHPIAQGFEAGEVIPLAPSESGVPANVLLAENLDKATTKVIFQRGPESPQAGAPILFAFEDEGTGNRMVFGFFALYRLPERAQQMLVLNALQWLLGK